MSDELKPLVMPEPVGKIVYDVLAEIKRQREIHPKDDHPSLDVTLLNRGGGCTPQRMAEHYEMPTEERAKFLCDTATKKGELTWAHIAVEELAEVICEFDEDKMRVEIIQLIAVLVSWVKCIDGNAGEGAVRDLQHALRSTSEAVDHPNHYGGEGNPYEAIKVIEALGLGEGFVLGNALKYVMRAGKKYPAKEIEDLEKAKWYIDRRIEQCRGIGQV